MVSTRDGILALWVVAVWLTAAPVLAAAAGEGAAAEAVVINGLSVSIAAAKPAFGEKEHLEFAITYRNTTDKGLWLFNPALAFSDDRTFARLGTFVVTDSASGEAWRLVCVAEILRKARDGDGAYHLKAGAAFATTLSSRFLAFAPVGEHSKAPQFLKPGRYRLQAELVLGRPEAEDRSHQYWTGRVKLDPVEFAVGGVAKAQALIITEEAKGKTVNAVVGQTIEVRLDGERPRTGWEASAPEGEAVRREGAQPGEVGASPRLVFTPKPGAADKAIGTYAFRYKAVRPGQAKLRVVYVSPGGPEPVIRRRTALVKEFVVTVRVTAAPQGPGEF